jgi:GAF domain-containing protein
MSFSWMFCSAPVLNGESETVGVIQVINRANGVFTDTDEEVLGILAAQSGIAMQNAKLFQKSMVASRKVGFFLLLYISSQCCDEFHHVLFDVHLI